MEPIASSTLFEIAAALRSGTCSARELMEEGLRRHAAVGGQLHAYKHLDPAQALADAQRADAFPATGDGPLPFLGIPISVKDLYGVTGLPTFAGTARQLPDRWSRDAWLVARLREMGAVVVGKTHTVEMAYGAVGINPHWGTPWNPWNDREHRIPGGSSCGAGVSLWEGSALVALGTDTGGSIRIPASMTGVVGHKTTKGRWPTDGVVQLSSTLDTVGALTRTVEDSIYFFGAVDPAWGDPAALLAACEETARNGLRVAVPRCGVWDECQTDIADVLHAALTAMASGSGGPAGPWSLTESPGDLLDAGKDLYMGGGMPGAECTAFLKAELPGWLEILHPTVGSRLAGSPALDSPRYAATVEARARLMARTPDLFEGCDVLALPTAIITPPTVSACEDLEAYVRVNGATLRPTGLVGMLGLCAVTVPVGLDGAGMPVGLQLIAPGGRDELALSAALAVERRLGPPRERLGIPPIVA